MHLNPIKCLHWDGHTPRGACTYIPCMKFIELYFKEETENPKIERHIFGVYGN